MNKKLLFISILILCFFCTTLMAQKPDIYNINNYSGPTPEEITITGTNFGPMPSVFFSNGAKATINYADNNMIKVEIPTNIAHGPIRVLNGSNSLSDYSSPFLPSFGGEGLTANDFKPAKTFTLPQTASSFDIGDLDGDDKPEIVTHYLFDNDIYILPNTSSFGNPNFEQAINIATISYQIEFLRLHDIDGDGRLDIVATTKTSPGEKQLAILRNLGGGFNFDNPFYPSLPLDNFDSQYLSVADIDKDGMPDIVISNKEKGDVIIIINTSDDPMNIDPITFDSNFLRLDFLGEDSKTTGIDLTDLNNDGLIDISITNFLKTNISYKQNKSNNDIAFGTTKTITTDTKSQLNILATADFDKDGKPDMLSSDLYAPYRQVIIAKNTSTTQDISFSNDFTLIPLDFKPFWPAIGDLDGDSYPDIAIASNANLGGNDPNIIYLLRNSANNTIAFDPVIELLLPIGKESSIVKVSDIDHDGKPDIIANSVNQSEFFVFSNKGCIKAKLRTLEKELVNNQLTVCQGPITLQANKQVAIGEYSYVWKKDGIDMGINPGMDNISVNASGEYQVIINSPDDCSDASEIVTINITGDAVPAQPNISGANFLCEGETLILTTDAPGMDEYIWQGPGGFIQTTVTNQLTINNLSKNNTGDFKVTVKKNNCESNISNPYQITVSAYPNTNISIEGGTKYTNSNQDQVDICDGYSIVLKATDQGLNNTNYRWKDENNLLLQNGLSLGLNSNQPGKYYLEIENNEGCISKDSINVISAPPITIDFNIIGCAGIPATFNNLTSHANYLPNDSFSYQWEIGNDILIGKSPNYIFENAGAYDVKLIVSHGNNCTFDKTVKVVIDNEPTVEVEAENNVSEICKGDSILLTASPGFSSYIWNTNQTGESIYIYKPGTYTVSADNGSGCIAEANIVITELLSPEVKITLSSDNIVQGEQIQAFVELTNGGTPVNYQWEPAEIFSDPNSPHPFLKPNTNTTITVYITWDQNKCTGFAQVPITVCENCLPPLNPKVLFSPNGDGIEDTWTIEGIDKCPDCEVSVFSKTGVLIFQSVLYSNSWNGSSKGKQLSEGTYYYKISRKGLAGKPLTGAVSIIR